MSKCIVRTGPAAMPARVRATATLTAALVRRLRAWYRRNRRDLPWRGTRDPYAVWVSEIMLQQTTAAAAAPYYTRLLKRFPDVAALAAADPAEVLKLWAGLGYYRRARSLHAAARQIVDRFDGRVPADPAELMTLPGVGRYTAGAIASFAFDRRAAVVDTNVARVLARLFRVDGDPRTPAASRRLWQIAETLVPARAPAEFNSALMELGATLCAPAAPRCDACPLRNGCAAFAAGRPTDWPQPTPRRTPVDVHEVAVVIERGRRVLAAQRRPGDLWAGMWEFPRGSLRPGESVQAAATRTALEAVGLTVELDGALPTVRHGVTFRRIRLDCRRCRARSGRAAARTYAQCRWVTLEQAAELPHSSPQAKVLANLRRARQQPGLFTE